MPIQDVRLIRKEPIAHDTMAFYFEKPNGFDYRAGQFGDITLIDPPETDAEGNVRGFSFITAPYESEIGFATRLRNTAFKRVLRNLATGSAVKLDAPYGDFRLHNKESRPAVFIIGGIGATPVRSIIAQASRDRTGHHILLLHANRSVDDAPFQSDFLRFAEQNQNFRFVPVITDAVPASWKGESGRIAAATIRRWVPDLTTPIWYLSGPEGMVKAMRRLLVEMEIDEDDIRTEEFSGY
ncbi:MAG: FAD-dependent oxidoreductase [Burkholderiaceae bacterium]|jgi:ferredoxin-NADP reductase|nr:FAD-dependent oxidoreductase [Burkholderiaceae bacterium]